MGDAVDVGNSCQYVDTNMPRQSTTPDDEIRPSARRRYDNSARRAQMAETRERILAAGSELAHRAQRWDWRHLTIGAIAAQAGVSERTIYRHFPTERDLHEALMRRLEQEAGVSYEALALGNMTDMTAKMFASLPSFSAAPAIGPRHSAFATSDVRRRESLLRAIADLTADWSAAERQMAAAALDVLWTPLSYERLTGNWGFSAEDATRVVAWAMEAVVGAIRAGERPEEARKRRKTKAG